MAAKQDQTLKRPIDRSTDDTTVLQRVGPGNSRRIGRRGLQIIERLAAEGHADASIARAIGLGRDAFRRHRRARPDVDEALARGRARMEDELTHVLLAKARKGDTVAAIFLLKGRCGWRDQGAPPEAGEKVNVTINLPGAMSEAEYRRLIDVTPTPRSLPDASTD